jgi:hypothetical protein
VDIDYKQFYNGIKEGVQIEKNYFCKINCRYLKRKFINNYCLLSGEKLKRFKLDCFYRCKKCKQYFGE